MKSALLFGISFLIVLPLVAILVVELEKEKYADAIESSLIADSLAMDSLNQVQTVSKDSIIDVRDYQIDSLNAELAKMVGERTQLSEEIEARDVQMAQDISEAFEVQTKKMAKLYENMAPEQAALIIAGLDDVVAISVITKMKKRQAGKILAALGPQKAIQLSREMSGSAE